MTMAGSKQKRAARKAMFDQASRGQDRPRCSYCGWPVSRKAGQPGTVPRDAPVRPFTMDHIIPKCAGGTWDQRGLLPACDACNFDRGDMPLDQFIESLGERAIMTVDQARSHMLRAAAITDGIHLVGQRLGFRK